MLAEESDPETIVSYWLELSLWQETRLTRTGGAYCGRDFARAAALGSVAASGLSRVRDRSAHATPIYLSRRIARRIGRKNSQRF